MAIASRTRSILARVRRVVRHPLTRGLVGIGALLGGLGLAVLAMGVGHCSFAGGRCPADPVPLWQDDVFGMVATGLVMAVAVPILAWRPSRRGVRAALAGAAACLPVAWLVAEAARTGSW